MNYLLIMTANILYSLQFLMTGAYSRRNKSSAGVSLAFVTGTSFIIGIYVFIVDGVMNGFGIKITWYSALLSLAATVMNFVSNYFSMKSLRITNISLYSVFLMLGGMIVPSVFGVMVGESVTVGKILCLFLIIIAMMFSVDRTGGGKKGAIKYYLGCFFANGSFGIIAKALTLSEKYTVSSNDYLFTYVMMSAVVGFVILAIITRGKPLSLFADVKNIGCMAGYSVFHGIAEICSLFTLTNGMDVSVQQPLVSGGVLIASFFISLIMREKQSWKSVLSTAVAVLAVIAISFINIEVF